MKVKLFSIILITLCSIILDNQEIFAQGKFFRRGSKKATYRGGSIVNSTTKIGARAIDDIKVPLPTKTATRGLDDVPTSKGGATAKSTSDDYTDEIRGHGKGNTKSTTSISAQKKGTIGETHFWDNWLKDYDSKALSQVRVKGHLNPKIDLGKNERIIDFYSPKNSLIFECKYYNAKTKIDVRQASDYSKMVDTGYILTESSGKLPVKGVVYIFKTKESAKLNFSNLNLESIQVWYLNNGKYHHYIE